MSGINNPSGGSGTPGDEYATDAEVSAAVSAHAGASDPHTVYQKESEKGNANGYASLDAGGTIPDAQIPSGIARDSEVSAAYEPKKGTDDNYVTDAEKIVIGNTSGTNTGDQTLPDQLSDLTDDATHRLVTDTEKTTWNGKQDALGFTAVPTTRTINGLDLSANRTLTQDDIGDGVTNKAYTATEETKLAGIEAGAEVNVQADWNAVAGDAFINNKPSIPTQYTDEMAQDAVGAMATGSLVYVDATPTLQLSGDSTTPGNNKVYGTDGTGVKGWKADPTGGSGLTQPQVMARTLGA